MIGRLGNLSCIAGSVKLEGWGWRLNIGELVSRGWKVGVVELGLEGWDWKVGVGRLGLGGWDWRVGVGRLGLGGWDCAQMSLRVTGFGAHGFSIHVMT